MENNTLFTPYLRRKTFFNPIPQENNTSITPMPQENNPLLTPKPQ